MAVMGLALLIALAPSVHAFAMAPHAFARAFLEMPDHTASQLASPAGKAAAVNMKAHQHGDESLAIDGGACGCPASRSIDLCMAVCCAAILSQSLDPARARLPFETGFLLTIPSSASRLASHPPPEAIV
ncbi:MAG TPA: hypothetical protein VLR47_01160 [Rhodospirillales bacterium]|nr:hypothetical protein [Rhodospirillales bacterium]